MQEIKREREREREIVGANRIAFSFAFLHWRLIFLCRRVCFQPRSCFPISPSLFFCMSILMPWRLLEFGIFPYFYEEKNLSKRFLKNLEHLLRIFIFFARRRNWRVTQSHFFLLSLFKRWLRNFFVALRFCSHRCRHQATEKRRRYWNGFVLVLPAVKIRKCWMDFSYFLFFSFVREKGGK